jgi:hypothetical protein
MGKTLSKTNCCVVEQVSSSLSISADEKFSLKNDDEPILELEGSSLETPLPTVSLKLVLNSIQNSNETQEWPAMLSLTCEEQDIDLRAGLDLVCILETSSLTRPKERLLKNSVEFLMSRLTGQDRLSLITFSESTKRLSPLLSMTYTGKVRINLHLQSLSYSLGADLFEALSTGFSVLNNRRQVNQKTFLILLATGNDSNLETVEERFEVLLNEFLGKDVHFWAFGFSPSKVLNFLSEGLAGACFFPDNEKEWFKSLAFAAGIMESLVVSHVVAEVKEAENVKISKIYSENGEKKFRMPDGIAGRTTSVVILIQVPPGRARNLQDVLFAEVSFRVNNALRVVHLTLNVPFIDQEIVMSEIELDEEVLKGFYRSKCADILFEAAQIAEVDFDTARLLILKGCEEFEESCLRENSFIQMIILDMKNCLNFLGNSLEFHARTRCLARNHWLKYLSGVEDYQNKSTSINRFRLKTLFNIV